MSFGLSDFAQAIFSAILLAAILVLYLYRFAYAQRWLPIALGVCLLDQALKVYVIANHFSGRPLPLFGGAVQITYLRNREQGFGSDISYLLFLTAICVLALLFLYYRLDRMNYRMSRLAEVGFAIMIGGYLGILLDRIMLGSVIDFIEFGKRSQFVYNLADLAVILAMGLLCIRVVRFLTEPAGWGKPLKEGVVREG